MIVTWQIWNMFILILSKKKNLTAHLKNLTVQACTNPICCSSYHLRINAAWRGKKNIWMKWLTCKLQITADKMQVKLRVGWFLEIRYLASLHWEQLPHVLLANGMTKTVHQQIVRETSGQGSNKHLLSHQSTKLMSHYRRQTDLHEFFSKKKIFQHFLPKPSHDEILLTGMLVIN